MRKGKQRRGGFYRAGAAVAAVLLIAGCATKEAATPEDGVQLFQKQHPKDAAFYTHLYPVTLDNYKVLDQLHSDRVGDIVLVMKQKYPDTPGVGDYGDQVLKADQEMWKNVERNVAELGEICTPQETLCEFEWTDGLKTETGLLLLRGGDIVKRQTWMSKDVDLPAGK